MSTFNLKIVTPHRVLHDGQVSQISIPTPQGQITVLPHHIPLVSVVSAGPIEIKADHDDILIAVEGGFVEVAPGGIIILADAAHMADEIDEAKVHEAIERAQKALETSEVHDHNYEMLRALIERETSKMKVLKTYQSRRKV
jgi:F-type H+-transporting ATPase subunit epsilon